MKNGIRPWQPRIAAPASTVGPGEPVSRRQRDEHQRQHDSNAVVGNPATVHSRHRSRGGNTAWLRVPACANPASQQAVVQRWNAVRTASGKDFTGPSPELPDAKATAPTISFASGSRSTPISRGATVKSSILREHPDGRRSTERFPMPSRGCRAWRRPARREVNFSTVGQRSPTSWQPCPVPGPAVFGSPLPGLPFTMRSTPRTRGR